MIWYVIRRMLQALLVIWLVATAVFVMLQLQPGSTARAVLGQRAYPAEISDFNRVNGFDDPVLLQYGRFLLSVVRGRLTFAEPHAHSASDFINGYASGLSLRDLASGPLANTLLLLGLALVVAVPIGMALGAWLAMRAGSTVVRVVVGVLTQAGYAIPVFVLGLLLIQLLSFDTGWLPDNNPDWMLGDVLAAPAGLALPALTLAIGNAALFARYFQTSVADCLTADYITKARAIGASPWRILVRHVARNAAIPVVTLAATRVPVIFGVQVPLEVFFNYPGIGNLAWVAATSKQYYTLLGAALLVSVLVVVVMFAADMVQLALDPRVHYASTG